MSTADNAAACAQACHQAQELVAEVRKGQALPDALHSELQRLRALGDGERLRTFTRAIQKAIEGQGRHA